VTDVSGGMLQEETEEIHEDLSSPPGYGPGISQLFRSYKSRSDVEKKNEGCLQCLTK
jgi:hypothetical protein